MSGQSNRIFHPVPNGTILKCVLCFTIWFECHILHVARSRLQGKNAASSQNVLQSKPIAGFDFISRRETFDCVLTLHACAGKILMAKTIWVRFAYFFSLKKTHKIQQITETGPDSADTIYDSFKFIFSSKILRVECTINNSLTWHRDVRKITRRIY